MKFMWFIFDQTGSIFWTKNSFFHFWGASVPHIPTVRAPMQIAVITIIDKATILTLRKFRYCYSLSFTDANKLQKQPLRVQKNRESHAIHIQNPRQ